MIFETLITVQVLISILVYFSHRPLLIALLVMALSAIQGIVCYIILSKWIGLRIIIVFVGGMIVAFLYVTSLSVNNKFVISPINPIFLVLLFLLLIINTHPVSSIINSTYSPTILFHPRSFSVLIFLVIYLLVTLLVASKLSESFKGSLVEKF